MKVKNFLIVLCLLFGFLGLTNVSASEIPFTETTEIAHPVSNTKTVEEVYNPFCAVVGAATVGYLVLNQGWEVEAAQLAAAVVEAACNLMF